MLKNYAKSNIHASCNILLRFILFLGKIIKFIDNLQKYVAVYFTL